MKGIGKRVFLVAALVAAASLVFWLAERTGAAAGAFVQQGKLQANDGAAQDALGFSVAISGDTAVVGAPADATGSNTRQGAAYVYVRSGSTWTQQQKLTASDGIANDEFGYAVAIAGDTIFVGRHFTQAGNNARTRGAVYVFTRTGNVWTQAPTPLTPSDAADGDLFGSSLAVDGGTLVVGALQKNNSSTFFQGAAYVFNGAGASWTQQGKLLAADGGFASFFGVSVAVSGDTAVVGATGQAGISADSGRGAAYVFTRNGGAWSQQQKLLASDGAEGDAFGFSVGVSNDTAVVGSRLDTVGSTGGQGSAYVFTRSGTVWTEQQHLFGVETVQRNDTFGGSVAVSGDTIAVG
ncbi:MAG TPA: FG-GAP repeat protein, partial [Pyrinomonadaceae bacterium]